MTNNPKNDEKSDISQEIYDLNQATGNMLESEQMPAGSEGGAKPEESNDSDEVRAFFAGILSADLQQEGQQASEDCQVGENSQLLQDPSMSKYDTDPQSQFVLRNLEPLSPLRSLEAMGITIETQKNYQIKKYVEGYWFPTCHADGSLGQLRFLRRSVANNDESRSGIHIPILEWGNVAERTRPSGFGLQILRQLQARQAYDSMPIFICNNELDCLIMYQAGLPAISTFGGERNFDALARDMKELRVKHARIIFGNDAAGRSGASAMAQACGDQGIKATVYSLEGKRGHTLCDEWAQQVFDRDEFRCKIESLPIVGADTLKEWACDPEAGLPPGDCNGVVPYALATVEQLHNEPPPGFLIEGILPLQCLAMLSGRHSTGKSALAVDMGMCVASGRDWHGRTVVQGPVLYIAAEGGGGIPKRIQVWQAVHGTEDNPSFYLLREVVAMHEDEAQRRLMATFRQLNTGFALIIVDTLVLCSRGLDENTARDMSSFMEALQLISQATGATVLLIHHDNKAGEYRGSTALAAGVDTHLGISTGDSAASVRLEVLKQKDHEPARPMIFRRRVEEVLDCSGSPMSSFVYELDASSEALLSSTEQAVLQVLADITIPGDKALNNLDLPSDTEVNHAGATEIGGVETGITASEWEKACCSSLKISEATFARAKRRLLDDTVNAVQCDRPGQRGARHIVHPEWQIMFTEDSTDSSVAEGEELEASSSNEEVM